MKPIGMIPAILFSRGATVVDTPIPHDDEGQPTTYGATIESNLVAAKAKYRFQFRDALEVALDSPGYKVIRGFTPSNQAIYTAIKDDGGLYLTKSNGQPIRRVDSLPAYMHHDVKLMLKPDPRLPAVSVIDVDGTPTLRIDISGMPRIHGNFNVTVSATQGATTVTRLARAYVEPPYGLTSGESVPPLAGTPPTIQDVGLTPIRPLFNTLGAPYFDPVAEVWHKFYWTRDSATGPTYLVDLNMTTGDVDLTQTNHREYGKEAPQSGSDVFIGTYYPPELLRYNLTTGTMTTIGQPFADIGLSVFSMSLGPDGSVVMGAGLGKMALWRPGIGFTNCGSYGGVFAYDVAYNGTWVVGLIRGDNWRVIVFRPSDSFAITVYTSVNAVDDMNLFWDPNIPDALGNIRFVYQGLQYRIKPNFAVEVVAPYVPDPPLPSPPPQPQTESDLRPSIETPNEAIIYWKLPGTESWNSVGVPVTIEDITVRHVVPDPDSDEVLTWSNGYGTMDVFKPGANTSRRVGLHDRASCGAVARVDSTHVVALSYPGCNLWYFDTSRPFTTPTSLPGVPGIPDSHPDANPRMASISVEANDGGGLVVLEAVAGVRRAIALTLKQRYESGFQVVEIADVRDPTSYTLRDYPQIIHHGMSWHAEIDGGSKVAIATNLKIDSTRPDVPSPSQVVIFMLDTGTMEMGSINPLRGVDNYGQIVQVGPEIVGIHYDSSNPSGTLSVLFRANIATGALIYKRSYSDPIGYGIPPGSETGIPRTGPGFILGPDGNIWTASQITGGMAMQTIHPVTLEVTTKATFPSTGWMRIGFKDGYVYAGGSFKMKKFAI
jgi:hypothetical protein